MQWNGARPDPSRPAPLRALMDILQEKAAPAINEYGERQLPGYGGGLFNSIVRSGTEMAPGLGDVLAVEDLQTAAQNNDWGGIGLGILGAIPGIPAIGRTARGGRRARADSPLARMGELMADSAPAPSRTSVGQTEAEAALARYRAVNPNDTGARVLNPGDQGYPTNAQWDEASQTYVAPVEPDYPIRAFHGSPHSFDRFSLDKIGTGEGTQAYGHGLYFAESEDVARSYRDTLSTSINDGAQRRLEREGGNLDAAIAKAREMSERYRAGGAESYARAVEEDLRGLERYQQTGDWTPGSMYEVGINAQPDTFLDWDAPLSQQPEIARRLGVDPNANATRAAEIRASVADDMRMSGRLEPDSVDLDRIRLAEELDSLDASGNASSYAPRSQQQIDEMLDRGINGIRYLDGNSRGVGEGSRNYVVFNDELVKILRKYGISGLGIGTGSAALLGSELERRGQAQEF